MRPGCGYEGRRPGGYIGQQPGFDAGNHIKICDAGRIIGMESYKEGVKAKLPALTLYLGLVVIFIVFAVICSMMGKNFLTLNNMFNIITQASIISIIAIGASLVIVTGGIDLSVGSIVGFVGIFGGLILKAGMPLIAMGILCIAAGAAFGLVNGCLVSYGKVPPFIVTLGAMQIARGLALLINGGQPISSFPKGLGSLMASKVLGTVPVSVIYVFVFYAVIIFVMAYTKFGRHVYAAGGNICAARLSGINVNKTVLMVYVLSGIFAAIGGIMLLSRLTYADPNAGSGYEMNAIASAVIGGISLSGGKGKIGNTLVGAIILSTLTCGLQIMNVATYYQTIVTGIVIIAAVFADKKKERQSE